MPSLTPLRCNRISHSLLQLSPPIRLAALTPQPHLLRHTSSTSDPKSKEKQHQIAIIGSGTIGLSFTALHLVQNPSSTISIYDSRPDLYDYITAHLPHYISPAECSEQSYRDRIILAPTLAKAVEFADIVQEQGPETEEWKTKLWPEVERHARSDALLWSSTSGITATVQSKGMKDKSRLMVVHPYNPPHIMPLLEVVPGEKTSQAVINRTVKYWRSLGRTPVVIKKECTGFVANRLAFALFREACSLVAQDVVSVKDLDAIVTASMGPRWSVAGPFKSYAAGGGDEGMGGFMGKIGGTVQNCWEASERDVEKHKINAKKGEKWEDKMIKQCDEAYGHVDTAERDARTRLVLQAVRDSAPK